MNHEFRFTAEKIRNRIRLVRAHRFRACREIAPFRLQALSGPDDHRISPACQDELPEIVPGTYWGGVNFSFRLFSRFRLPADWKNPALLLQLGEIGDIFNHPEALVLVDGEPVGSADRHHHTVSLKECRPGPHRLSLEGWTGWSDYPPDFDSRTMLRMPQCLAVETNPLLDEFLIRAECALEAALQTETRSRERTAILDALDHAFLALDTRHPLGSAMHASVGAALDKLDRGLESAGPPLDATLLGIGHAHMDVGYLWTVAETRRKNARTFSNVLRLMDEFPEYRFTHSQPALYAMTEEDFPAIFARMRSRILEGRWEAIGGMWVEPDTNMPGAEALVRQILLGRRWFREKFGNAETPILWLPDTFGFCWCLPQLMKLSGLKMMVTNKLNWNQHNRVPASTFLWQGMDGTRVPVHVLTTPRAVDHLPFPTSYKSDLSGAEVTGTLTNATETELSPLPICFGFGDGGGGPSEDLIRRALAFRNMPSMPRIRMGRARELLDAVAKQSDRLPVWNDELYFEGHRGVLTGQGWIKRANRKAEAALHRAELLCVLSGRTRMPAELTRAWRLLCLNQFHDILAGTCIPPVLRQARRDFAEILETCNAIEACALTGFGTGEPGVLNPSPLPRHDLALVDGPLPDCTGLQEIRSGTLVGLPLLPGYGCARLADAGSPGFLSVRQEGHRIVMRNSWLVAEIGPDGALVRLFDVRAARDILMPGEDGNRLWAFEDRPLAWDAWDIDPFFEDRAEEVTDVRSVGISEHGPLRIEVTVSRRYRNSLITQKIRLNDRSPRLDFATRIDWHESHVLLKAAFRTAVSASHAAYDVQWGRIDRPTTRDTPRDASRFEVCAQKWVALHDGSYAVALLNDGKYGHDVRDNVIRVTLLKSATSPDPDADQGRHEFTYSIMGQQGAGYLAIRAEAEALNHPVIIAPGLGDLTQPVASDRPNVLVETIKPSEGGAGSIFRLYEAEGLQTCATLTFPHEIRAASETDLLETVLTKLCPEGRRLRIDLAPRQIRTLRIES